MTGQIFGVRWRERFLFSQPRPVAMLSRDDADWDVAALVAAAPSEFETQYTDLNTDLESFNTDPKV